VVEENPTNVEVIAELLTGRTPVGGRVRGVSGVSSDELDRSLALGGFAAIGRRDLHADPRSAAGSHPHAAASSYTPLGQLLRSVRDRVDDYGHVTDFVRAYTLAAPRHVQAVDEVPTCFLSVVVRSQGARSQHLLEVLTCLAAQSDGDLEVVVVVHDGDPEAVGRVRALADLFDDEFGRRVRVLQVDGGRRGAPLAAGLAAARGEYAAFLDDDDHVTGNWVETFRATARLAPGCVVRSRCGEQHLRYVDDPEAVAEWVATSDFSVAFGTPWDFIWHIHENRTPIHAFAVPMASVRRLGITVDGVTPILEDWGFLLRISEVCGVRDTGEVTAVYQRWDAADRSHVVITPEVWSACRTLVLEGLNAGPLVIPKGEALRLAMLADPRRHFGPETPPEPVVPLPDHEAAVGVLRAAIEQQQREADEARSEADSAHARAALAAAEAAAATVQIESARAAAAAAEDRAGRMAQRVVDIEESEWWRLTGPFRHGADRVRRLWRGRSRS
jgi:hypothetical protein